MQSPSACVLRSTADQLPTTTPPVARWAATAQEPPAVAHHSPVLSLGASACNVHNLQSRGGGLATMPVRRRIRTKTPPQPEPARKPSMGLARCRMRSKGPAPEPGAVFRHTCHNRMQRYLIDNYWLIRVHHFQEEEARLVQEIHKDQEELSTNSRLVFLCDYHSVKHRCTRMPVLNQLVAA